MTIVDRHRRDDAGAGRRARHAAGPRRVEDAARRRVAALPGRRRRGADHHRRRLLDHRQQHGAGAVRLAQPLRARRAGRPAARLRLRPSALPHAGESRLLVTSAVSLVAGGVRHASRTLALASAISRLLVYVGDLRRDAAAALSRASPARVQPATFVVPFGPVIPVTAIVIALAILAGARREQLYRRRRRARRGRRALPDCRARHAPSAAQAERVWMRGTIGC